MRAIMAIFCFLLCSFTLAQELPKLPYHDWGACPFECCTYGEWEAARKIKVYKSRTLGSSVAFELKKGDSVHAITGVVITESYGVTKILQPIKIGYTPTSKSPELSLKAGETVYTLHYLGEASDLFWYQGKVYSDQISVPDNAMGTPPNAGAIKVISRPKYEWWAKIRNKDGLVGWSNEANGFAHVDACE